MPTSFARGELLILQTENRVAEIKLHGISIEFDVDNELCFDLPNDTNWFYLREGEVRELRDFLNRVIASPSTSASQQEPPT